MDVTTSERDPEEATASGAPAVAEIPAATSLGAVHLTVADLQRSVTFYEQVVGLRVRDQDAGQVTLGTAARDLLVLYEQPGARPADGYSGLFHFALLLPERIDLARWLAHAVRDRAPLTGLSDHFVSEAIYLRDPDHHGIEIYWDRPRERWEGMVAQRMTTLPLDVPGLLELLDDPATDRFERLPGGTRMGHVHLRVAEVDPTVAFYRDTLGFALTAQLGRQAAFLSAGGYHHHLGANTWESAGRPAAPADTATLRHATIMLPTAVAREEIVARIAASGRSVQSTPAGVLIRDPSGNGLVLQAADA
jgi:catechol 2,3-dioxygenase